MADRMEACNKNPACTWEEGFGCARRHQLAFYKASFEEFSSMFDQTQLQKLVSARQALSPLLKESYPTALANVLQNMKLHSVSTLQDQAMMPAKSLS